MISNITHRIAKKLRLDRRPPLNIQTLYQKALAEQFPNYIINASSIKNYNVGYQFLTERSWDYTTLDDWKENRLKLKFQIFISLLRLVYFLQEENVVHKNIKPNTLLFKNNKVFLIDFGDYSSDLRNFSNQLDQVEARRLYPYLTEEILLKLKDKKFSEIQRRGIGSRRRADREALALIMMEIFHPVPFQELKQQITIEEALNFRQNIFEEIKKMERSLTIQNDHIFVCEVYQFVIEMLKNLLSQEELPDKRVTLQRCVELKKKIPPRYIDNTLQKKEQKSIEISKEYLQQIFENSSERLIGNDGEILYTLPSHHQLIKQDCIIEEDSDNHNPQISSNQNSKHARQEIGMTQFGQNPLLNQNNEPESKEQNNSNRNSVLFSQEGEIYQLNQSQGNQNQNPIDNQQLNIQEENEDILDIELLEDQSSLDVDSINEPPADNKLLKQFQTEQANKIGKYQVGNQYENDHCQVTQQMIAKGKFINNCFQNGKITLIINKKDKILIKVFENVSVTNLIEQTQNNRQVEIKLINGQNSELTKFQICYQKQRIKFKRVYHYSGILFYGKPHNYGIMKNYQLNFKYIGDWIEGKREGFGTLKMLDDKFYQQGKFYKYEGDFKANLLHGKGKYYLKDDGSLYEEGYFCENIQKFGFHTIYKLQNKQITKNLVLYLNFCNQAKIRIQFPFYLE